MNKYYKIALLGLGHLFVDLQGIYLINNIRLDIDIPTIAVYFLIYNLIAFAMQPVVGYFADKYNLYFSYIIIGLILPMIALQVPSLGIFAIVVATLGNALYHVGGGVKSINLFPNKAAPAGVFVAPGAIGVFIGARLALSNVNYQLYILIMAVITIVMLYFIFKNDKLFVENKKINKNVVSIVVFIMIIVFIRGFIGLGLLLPWKSDVVLGLTLVFSVFFGKFFGGILGDKFGFKTIGISGLLISLPLLILGYYYSALGIIGALLFNLTMAITLFIIIDSLGRYKGFAFGLTTLALFISYIPSAFGLSFNFNYIYIIIASILGVVGAILLYRTINLYEKGR